MFKKKKELIYNKLFEVYCIAHEALSEASISGDYSAIKYIDEHEKLDNTIIDLAHIVGGDEGALKFSIRCAGYHDDSINRLNKMTKDGRIHEPLESK